VGMAGRRYVERNHDWSAITEKLAGIYDESLTHL
jgi:hypothetical protein